MSQPDLRDAARAAFPTARIKAYRAVQQNGGGAAPQGNDTAADDDHWRGP